MKLVGILSLLICFYFFISFVEGSSRKVVDDIAIQDLNLLLPLTTGKVKASYHLKAFNGCFKW